ncbi:MAG: B12-binding domain-containing protein [Actinomycetota bacterium]
MSTETATDQPDTTPAEGSHLSLDEAAERAGVHYMTVYRWVRTSRLPATKQGGRWVVDPDDLERMLDAGSKTGSKTEQRSSSPEVTVSRLCTALVSGDAAGAHRLLEDAMVGGLDAEQAHLDLLSGALVAVGEGWAAGELSVAQEHRATATAHRLLGMLAHHFNRPGRRRGTVVLGAPAGDRHALPTALLSGPVRGRGLDVIDLGADTPVSAFAEVAVATDRLRMIGIHTSVRVDRAVTAAIEAIRDAQVEVPILVGGGGVTDADHARELGADEFAASSWDALEKLTSGDN